jgi:phosphoribosylanthranilate isomerase
MSTPIILACSIQNLTDARYFAAWEADWLVFGCDPGAPDFVPPVQIAAMAEWIQGPAIAGTFGVQDALDIRLTASELNLGAIVADMAVPLETLREIEGFIPIFKEITLSPDDSAAYIEAQFQAFSAVSDAFILNAWKNRIGWQDLLSSRFWPLAWIQHCCAAYPVFIAIDALPSEYGEIHKWLAPKGFCLRGGDEEKTGLKSFDELDDSIQEIRNLV